MPPKPVYVTDAGYRKITTGILVGILTALLTHFIGADVLTQHPLDLPASWNEIITAVAGYGAIFITKEVHLPK